MYNGLYLTYEDVKEA
jgi:hypothetical protein